MPHLSIKDAELVIALLRQRSGPSDASTAEGRLLRRLERRVAKPQEALENWKRRGHTEMVNGLSQARRENRTTETRSRHCHTGPDLGPLNRKSGGSK